MIKIEAVDVWGFKHTIRGMRNPMNSWDKSDSYFRSDVSWGLGSADLDLMHRLFIGGTEHRKFMRMIHVSMDVTAPLYWWKEYDTYKVSTVANSCSTMHKIHAKEFTLDDFSTEHLIETVSGATDPLKCLDNVIYCLNYHRNQYISTKDKQAWWQMIQLLPSSYNQKRTLDFNYETAVQIIRQRTGHKLDEWHKFVDVLWDLPYMREIVGDQSEQK
jgi:hypothetical protein